GTPGGTAFFAHIGGFVFGILLLRLCLKRQGPPESDEQLPMPFFVSAALVVYGAAAIGFSVYRANTAPVVPATTNVIAPAIKQPAIAPASHPQSHSHSSQATHKHHKTQAKGH
ncbi:MAG: hypothetical protein JSS83_21210, partial [Cyanobacteria bacterium SZAS LIN-3]|nr:hypothetical protein [Cyanobacteria bacterium SZAS LIN-3]